MKQSRTRWEMERIIEKARLQEASKTELSPENKKKLRKILVKVKNGEKLNDAELDAFAAFVAFLK